VLAQHARSLLKVGAERLAEASNAFFWGEVEYLAPLLRSISCGVGWLEEIPGVDSQG
jgi:hypothetical protein